MAKGQQDQELTQAEIAHLGAQDEALRRAAEQEAARTAIASQEQGTRAAQQASEQRASEAKTATEQELSPFQQMLAASQAGAPALQEHANRVKAAIDIYQTMSAAKTAQDQIKAQRDIEAGREAGAMARQKEQTQGNVTDAMITHLVNNPDYAKTLPTTLENMGQPALANAVRSERAKTVADQIATNKAQIPVMQKTGNLDKLLAGIPDAEVRAGVQPFVDEAMKTPGVAPSTAARLTGQGAKNLGIQGLTTLGLGPAALGAPVFQLTKSIGNANWKKAAQEFYGGLTQ